MPKRKTSTKRPTTVPTNSRAAVVSKKPTKQTLLIEMLERPQGATIVQLAKALGWQEHTVRGTISGALKKRLGLTITSKQEEPGRVYRISTPARRAS